ETWDDTTEIGRLTGCGASGVAEDGPPSTVNMIPLLLEPM
ncbi:hypothetical protein Tco_0592114, partial [Tanacetum coccineum]